MQMDFVNGAGLGLRRGLLGALQDCSTDEVDFLELAPENWIGVGGRLGKQLRALSERLPLLCHGLSLNLGGFAPLDIELLKAIKGFLDLHGVRGYSEHLSACADHGQLYDLMPLPFSEESVRRIAERVRIVQDVLERPLIIENVSAYAQLPGELDEATFVSAVLEQADCQLLLDVNNVFVNSINFNFDAAAYIAAMPSARIAYLHVAGHYDQASDLRGWTFGQAVACLKRTPATALPWSVPQPRWFCPAGYRAAQGHQGLSRAARCARLQRASVGLRRPWPTL